MVLETCALMGVNELFNVHLSGTNSSSQIRKNYDDIFIRLCATGYVCVYAVNKPNAFSTGTHFYYELWV